MFVISLFDTRHYGLTTYLARPTKKLLQKLHTQVNLPKAVQPTQPTSQSCPKINFKQTNRVCPRFWFAKPDDYFCVNFDHFKIEHLFWGSWGSIKNLLEPKTKTPLENLACPNPWNALYVKKYLLPNIILLTDYLRSTVAYKKVWT